MGKRRLREKKGLALGLPAVRSSKASKGWVIFILLTPTVPKVGVGEELVQKRAVGGTKRTQSRRERGQLWEILMTSSLSQPEGWGAMGEGASNPSLTLPFKKVWKSVGLSSKAVVTGQQHWCHLGAC